MKMKEILKGEYTFDEVEAKGITRYVFTNLVKLGCIVNSNGKYKTVCELGTDAEIKLMVAVENYRSKHPNKEKRESVTKELMNQWLEVLFIQDGYFPVKQFCKEIGVRNANYFIKSLIELKYIKSVQRIGTEILETEYDLDEVYKKYCEHVKNHTKKYKKTKRSYATAYGAV